MSYFETDIHLPSQGIFYEDGLSDLTIRNLSTGDEQKIFGSTSNNTLDKVLSKCCVTPEGFDIDKLLPGDKFFYMVKLRIHTYGDMYKQPFYCIHCDREGEIEYSLDDVEIIELDPTKVKIPIKIKLPVSGDIITLRVLNSGLIKKLQDNAKKKEKRFNVPAKELLFMLRLAREIETVNGDEVSLVEAQEYAQNLHAKDRAYINSALVKLEFGYKNTVTVKCPLCGEELTIPFEMTGEFFNPSTEVEFL